MVHFYGENHLILRHRAVFETVRAPYLMQKVGLSGICQIFSVGYNKADIYNVGRIGLKIETSLFGTGSLGWMISRIC